ncbi:MAG TPA: cytochrome c biogenesis protein CcsA [Tepidisphaeraceae bacterium]|jgi:hypothetical protein
MFDLDQSIAAWRNSLPEQFRSRIQLLDELEQHLRDDIDRRIASGASPAEAWNSALTQLGSLETLSNEFAKLDKRMWAPAWIATAVLLLVVASVGYLAITLRRPLLGAHVLFVTTGYVAVFAIGFLAFISVLTRAIGLSTDHQLGAFKRTSTRLAMLAALTTCIGVALGAIWAHANLGHWWTWDPREIGGACVLAWTAVLIQSFRSRSSAPLSLMLLGVMGNIVVACSWFGPALFIQKLSYGYTPAFMSAILGSFLIAQILVIYIALLPAGALSLQGVRGPRVRGSGRAAQ